MVRAEAARCRLKQAGGHESSQPNYSVALC